MKHKAKIMVVDDSALIVSMMEVIVKAYGIDRVSTASNGRQALEEFAVALENGAPYSVVFMDVVMPVMDGQEALKLMRQLEREAGLADEDRATIIMSTSLGPGSDVADALLAGGCSGYLVKPFRRNDVFGLLGKHVR
jgi:two-component system, chemotaxis family, chemotaxis protein CheY